MVVGGVWGVRIEYAESGTKPIHRAVASPHPARPDLDPELEALFGPAPAPKIRLLDRNARMQELRLCLRTDLLWKCSECDASFHPMRGQVYAASDARRAKREQPRAFCRPACKEAFYDIPGVNHHPVQCGAPCTPPCEYPRDSNSWLCQGHRKRQSRGKRLDEPLNMTMSVPMRAARAAKRVGTALILSLLLPGCVGLPPGDLPDWLLPLLLGMMGCCGGVIMFPRRKSYKYTFRLFEPPPTNYTQTVSRPWRVANACVYCGRNPCGCGAEDYRG